MTVNYAHQRWNYCWFFSFCWF